MNKNRFITRYQKLHVNLIVDEEPKHIGQIRQGGWGSLYLIFEN
jgi:hypothetical protein